MSVWVQIPRITLADLNLNSLQKAAERLKRYHPQIHQMDVLEPAPLQPASYGSISLNYVLHCLPGTMSSKSVAFQNLKPLLKKNGVLFGSTILGKGVSHNFLARQLINFYNANRIFTNVTDDLESLRTALGEHFTNFEVYTKGNVAIFIARV